MAATATIATMYHSYACDMFHLTKISAHLMFQH